jgi:hypothetical protein
VLPVISLHNQAQLNYSIIIINLTPFIPLSTLGEGEDFLKKRGLKPPLKHPPKSGAGGVTQES